MLVVVSRRGGPDRAILLTKVGQPARPRQGTTSPTWGLPRPCKQALNAKSKPDSSISSLEVSPQREVA